MGRTAYGVRGIQLREGDEVVAMQVAKPGGTLLTVTEKGYAKQTELDEYRVTGRGGLGVKNVEVTDKNGHVVGIAQVHDNEELLVITEQGKILRTPANEIRTDRPRHAGRAADGSRRAKTRSCRSRWSRRPKRMPVQRRFRRGSSDGPEPRFGRAVPTNRGTDELASVDRRRRAGSCSDRAAGGRLLAAAGTAVADAVLPRRPRPRQHHDVGDVGGRRSIRASKGTVESFLDHHHRRRTARAAQLQAAVRGADKAAGREAEFLQDARSSTRTPTSRRSRRSSSSSEPGREADARAGEGQGGVGQVARGHHLAPAAVSTARGAVGGDTAPAEASLTQPGQPPLDPKTFEGETITKDVVVAAKVKTPEGADVDKTLTITFDARRRHAGGATREGPADHYEDHGDSKAVSH